MKLHLGSTFGGPSVVFFVLFYQNKSSEDLRSSETSGLYLVWKKKIKKHFKCNFQTVGFLQTVEVSE